MANTNKNSFVLYTDYIEQIEMLTMEQRGVLLTALIKCQMGDELPDMDNLTQMAFLFISSDMRRNNERYLKMIERRREAGRKGGKQRQTNQANQANQANATFATFAQANQANQAVNVNVDVNDNDNDNVNDNESVNVNEDARSMINNAPLVPPEKRICQAYIDMKATMRGIKPDFDAEKFINYYNARDWMSGQTKILNWKAAVDNWLDRSADREAEGEEDPFA